MKLEPPVLKQAFCQAANWSGFSKWSAFRDRRRVKILMFHGVTDDPPPPPLNAQGHHVPLSLFRKQMLLLAKRRRVIALDDYLRWVNGGEPIPEYSVVLTFDDGYLNNRRCAAPVLSELGLPATFFVCPRLVETGYSLWVDRLEHTIARARARRVVLEGNELPLVTDQQRISACSTLKAEIKKLDRAQRRFALDELSQQADAPNQELSHYVDMMKWSDIEALANDGFAIGSHSMSHEMLTVLPLDEVRQQIEESREMLARKLGEPPRYFAFPYGGHNVQVQRAVREAGYELSLCTEHGWNDQHTPRWALKRNEIGGIHSVPYFLAAISGVLDRVRSLRV